ncbi:MAG: ribonucleoside-diphosphate reductase subunit alpha, partial [Candidatus Pacebacteria bacterium]|nr:ribonucleoside-diphosphate reductase subunit alpha [Candidatus Paceibacterota bacterium]
RIQKAVASAYSACGIEATDDLFAEIASAVVAELEANMPDNTPHVEQIQNLVEKTIASKGHFEVSRAYILYRAERSRMRAEKEKELIERIERNEILVQKRNGDTVPFNIEEIRKAINLHSAGLEAYIDVEEVIKATKRNLYDGIPTSEINKAIIMALKARIERDHAYSLVAARFLYNEVYHAVLNISELDADFAKKYKEGLKQQIEKGIAAKRLDPRMATEFDFAALSGAIEPSRDKLFSFLGAQTLFDRYFLRDHEQQFLEMPQYFWMRIAMGLSLLETDKTASAVKIYNIISALRVVPSTPTLLHSGTTHPQMSSCYLTTVEDDLAHIFKSIGDNAQLAKWSGGVANDWTNIRATNAVVKSINTGSQGLIPFLKIVDATTASINRSGKRRGATVVYLETWHLDVEEFLDLRKNTGDDRRRTHDINTAHWIPDLFMKRVEQDEMWTMFSPEEVPDLHDLYGKKFEEKYIQYEKMADEGKINLFKRVPANTLWKKMITMLFETGHPWITFKDPSNIRSPQDHVGVVHSSNLCTEITLNTSAEETAVCNLGSVNLIMHVVNGKLDKKMLEETVHTGMRMLDNVIDINFYPTKEGETSNLRHRPVGLGIMGLQDTLYATDMSFDTDEAVAFSDETMEFISYHAILASSMLAKEKGSYSSYKGSKWDRNIFPIDSLKLMEEERGIPTDVDMISRMDWTPVREHVKQYGMRNSNCMAIAPTATIANISGSLPSIEPIYKNLYVKSNFSGEFTVVNQYLIQDLRPLGLWNSNITEKLKYFDGSLKNIREIPEHLRNKYKEVFEIDPIWIIKHAAYRGKWIDQSQSINIFTASQSGKAIADVYKQAWYMGLKTTYYLRTLGASSVEKSTLDINKIYDNTPEIAKVEIDTLVVPKPQFVAAAVAATATAAAASAVDDTAEAKPEMYVFDGEICESCQ